MSSFFLSAEETRIRELGFRDLGVPLEVPRGSMVGGYHLIIPTRSFGWSSLHRAAIGLNYFGFKPPGAGARGLLGAYFIVSGRGGFHGLGQKASTGVSVVRLGSVGRITTMIRGCASLLCARTSGRGLNRLIWRDSWEWCAAGPDGIDEGKGPRFEDPPGGSEGVSSHAK